MNLLLGCSLCIPIATTCVGVKEDVIISDITLHSDVTLHADVRLQANVTLRADVTLHADVMLQADVLLQHGRDVAAVTCARLNYIWLLGYLISTGMGLASVPSCYVTLCRHVAASLSADTLPRHSLLTRCCVTLCRHVAALLSADTLLRHSLQTRCRVTLCRHVAASLSADTLLRHSLQTRCCVTLCRHVATVAFGWADIACHPSCMRPAHCATIIMTSSLHLLFRM